MAIPTCIDLKATFGSRYRITADESATPRNSDPWLWRIPCRYGVVWPWGGDRLAVSVDFHRAIARQVRALPGVVMEQGGDDEFTFSFPMELFDAVAALVRPHRRPQYTEEQLEAARQRLAAYAFPKRRVASGVNGG